MYLKSRVTDRDGEIDGETERGTKRGRIRERKRSSIHCITHQIASTARAEHHQSWKPGTSSRSPTWVAGPQTCGIFCCFPRHINRQLDPKWNNQDLNQCLYHMPFLSISSFTCYSATLVSVDNVYSKGGKLGN